MALPRIATADVLRTLEELYPDAQCALHHQNPFELLIATILSAQCTDKRVNQITPKLFSRFPTPKDLAQADISEVESLIMECGLFKMKAKNIVGTSQALVANYDSQVPRDMEKLTQLPGVGRKTANVVLSNAFGIPAIAVDTHVQRVSNRLGLAQSDNVLETEQQLMKRIPKDRWSSAHHWLIEHGRQVCLARSPKCELCSLATYCRYFKAQAKLRGKARSRAKAASLMDDAGNDVGSKTM
ncbi:endonuclease III [Sulfoacidibacillus thermotolerans]|uniref:Endonuclease III n=1 Tax=Sulfoacidibacillus thermotolerans TaxID=1765684 RepID=A0A2U3D9Y7_SULT2|nr:endonuclease III [Sulfoacidibacillus thermotolerans]PWI58100.1 endonuclease III [Sulfoacidibacillus thermotolerans]